MSAGLLASIGGDQAGQGLQQGLDLVLHGNPVVVHTTLRTLRLAVESTAIAAVVAVPLGCAIGLGRSAAARATLALANGLVRFPPVGVGVVVVLATTTSSPWGGGPLAALDWSAGTTQRAYFAQTLLAAPILAVLTATAVRGVHAGLLEQARAYGASSRARGRLALREARRAVVAAFILAMGVTITAIGALIVSAGNADVRVDDRYEPATLAVGAYQGIKQLDTAGRPAAGADVTTIHSAGLAVAYSIILIGLFAIVAGLLTWLQEHRQRATA